MMNVFFLFCFYFDESVFQVNTPIRTDKRSLDQVKTGFLSVYEGLYCMLSNKLKDPHFHCKRRWGKTSAGVSAFIILSIRCTLNRLVFG